MARLSKLVLICLFVLFSFMPSIARGEPEDKPLFKDDIPCRPNLDVASPLTRIRVSLNKIDEQWGATYIGLDGKQRELPPNFRNGSRPLFQVTDINPFVQHCTISVKDNPVVESAVADFLKIIGAPSGQLAAPTAAKTPAKLATTTSSADNVGTEELHLAEQSGSCLKQYNQERGSDVAAVRTAAQNISKQLKDQSQKLQSNIDTFQQKLENAQLGETSSGVRKLFEPATPGNDGQSVSTEPQPLANLTYPPNALFADQLNEEPIAVAADNLGAIAVKLHGTPTKFEDGSCKADLKDTIAADQSALEDIFSGPKSLQVQWKAQADQFEASRQSLISAEHVAVNLVTDPDAFCVSHQIDSVMTTQDTVTVTVSCAKTDLSALTVSSDVSLSASAAPPKKPATGKDTTKPQDADTHTFTLTFGLGPRTYLAGGLSVAPLTQHSYTTTTSSSSSATGSAASAAASTATTSSTIIDQNGSSTRILPMALLHVRYWDFYGDGANHPNLDSFWRAICPCYLSAGLTAKPNSQTGTSVEDIFGPSVATLGQHLFVTLGAYAGEQDRLRDGLAVGSSTSLGATNLPIAKQYHWKLGFALSYPFVSSAKTADATSKGTGK